MRTDGKTDMTKLIVAFLNFAKAPKNEHETRPVYLNKKGKFVPVHAMKAYREIRIIALLFLNLGTG
jgi:hypothetical protein